MKRYFILSLLLLILNSCATPHQNPHMALTEEKTYFSLLEKQTEKKQVYDGLMNLMDFSATLMSADLSRAQLDQNARIFQWTPEQYATEKGKLETNLAKQTEIFLSFFVPERKQDDLHKTTTKWKLFLDANGKRFEGKASKIKGLPSEIQSLYPQHNRWSTPYKVVFPVPTAFIDAGSAKLTVTGPITSASVEFKKSN